MVALSELKKKTTLQAIEELSEKQELRPYLGASALGHSCERFLWYAFRWCYEEEISARIMRLFNRGHREEPEIVKTLAKVGITCYDDQAEVIFCHGHAKGHCDGKSIGIIEAPKTPHLNEYKTMSDKYFKDVCKVGVKASKPVYYAQMQIYMKYLKLTRALFIAVNKNDDSMYIERVHYDAEAAKELERKAENIVLSEEPPKKKFKPTWYACKFCSAKSICHGGGKIHKSCRTCVNCDIEPNGKWRCSALDLELSTSQQRLGCKKYEILECLNNG